MKDGTRVKVVMPHSKSSYFEHGDVGTCVGRLHNFKGYCLVAFDRVTNKQMGKYLMLGLDESYHGRVWYVADTLIEALPASGVASLFS